MKKTVFFVSLLLIFIPFLSAKTYLTSGHGEGLWSDPASWMIAGQETAPDSAPSEDDDIVIRHFLSHVIDHTYVHRGGLTIEENGILEIIATNDLKQAFRFAGPRFHIKGTLIVGGHLSHDQGEMIFAPEAWVMIGGNLDLQSPQGTLNQISSCGGLEISGNLQVNVETTFASGQGKWLVLGELQPYRGQRELITQNPLSVLAGIFSEGSSIHESIEACQEDLVTLSGVQGEEGIVWWGKFQAEREAEKVNLTWEAEGSFGELFAVERSIDGLAFEKISELSFESPATGSTTYAFTDSSRPALGTVFYRVRFADVSGRESLSQTRKLAVEEEAPLVRAFPNPFSQGPLTLLMEGLNAEQPVVVFVYNLAGVEVAKFATYPNLPNGLVIDELPTLSQGFYSVKVEQGTLRSSTRLIIQ